MSGLQVCFWATLTSNLYRNDTREHSRLALMQFRHAARMALRQADGAPKSLIFFDRFWPSHVSDQQRGVHFSHLVNIWDAQRLLNVYHGISSRHITEMEVDSEIDTPTKFSGNMAPQCVLTVDRHLARAACDWLPERVTFAKSCVLTEDDPGETGPVHMFKRNCTAEVEILHR